MPKGADKKFPCEECRNQKRKCNGNQPCDRCFKLRLRCEYVKVLEPDDEIYVRYAQEKETIENIAALSHDVQTMQQDLKKLKRTAACCAANGPLALSNGLTASLTKQTNHSWSLTVKKDGISVNTKVNTFVELLNHLQHGVSCFHLQGFIPPNVYNRPNILIGFLASIVRRKYWKNRFRGTTRSIRLLMLPTDPMPKGGTALETEPIAVTTLLQLIEAYLQCQHYPEMAIHWPTFYALFIEPTNFHDSPAAMALCASICSTAISCRHVTETVPLADRAYYGQHCFERARELLADRFDDPCLETMTAFIFMAKYKMGLMLTDEAATYASMAERITEIIKPVYARDKSGQGILFGRLQKQLRHIRTLYTLSKSGIESAAAFSPDVDGWVMADDDTVLEKRFLQMRSYHLELQRLSFEASRHELVCSDVVELLGTVAHRSETAIRHWHKQLPDDFKLSLPLFDASMPDLDFFAMLDYECTVDIIPALMTLMLYDEYHILGRSLLPKHMATQEADIQSLLNFWKTEYQNAGQDDTMIDTPPKVHEKWRRRVKKLHKLKAAINFEGSDQEYLEVISNTFVAKGCPNIAFAHTIDAAINTVRILQYLRWRTSDCYFEMRILIDTWRVLIQISKIAFHLTKDIQAMMPQVKKYLMICIDIVREECHDSQGSTGEYVMAMQTELQDLLADPFFLSLCHPLT